MNKYFIFFLLVSLTGCVAVKVAPESSSTAVSESAGVKKNLTNVRQLTQGMIRQGVEEIMGEYTAIGFKANDEVPGTYETITLKNPYREEVLAVGDKQYEVIYYLSSIQLADGLVADDELTPVVFENGQMIGKGQDFLFKLKAGM
ncbi:MAG: DUF3192 domain-containing protein [Candidatus Omnitrophica bacterium]|nr:DUF3192 domain-containing protein [Candidatus Omnitrophota bacterium]